MFSFESTFSCNIAFFTFFIIGLMHWCRTVGMKFFLLWEIFLGAKNLEKFYLD